jgi:DMSO reductase family type II enzyme heme b subunit
MAKKSWHPIFVVFPVLILVGCRPTPPVAPLMDVTIATADALPVDPDDAIWKRAPEFIAPLLPQDQVEPRQMHVSTSEVRVRAVAAGDRVAFRLQWTDPTLDDQPGQADFTDACAVQLPARVEPTLPAPQMGEPGRSVEITFWTAVWQAIVDGRGDTLRDLYPNATVDHYPHDAEPLKADPTAQREFEIRYSPARALGNTMGGPREQPVQDLIAEGPGTLSPAPSNDSQGRGQHDGDGWTVVVSRRLPAGWTPDRGSQVAFAVWQGDRDEVGARKMRTPWINLVQKP